jgi:hypothetical protein
MDNFESVNDSITELLEKMSEILENGDYLRYIQEMTTGGDEAGRRIFVLLEKAEEEGRLSSNDINRIRSMLLVLCGILGHLTGSFAAEFLSQDEIHEFITTVDNSIVGSLEPEEKEFYKSEFDNVVFLSNAKPNQKPN